MIASSLWFDVTVSYLGFPLLNGDDHSARSTYRIARQATYVDLHNAIANDPRHPAIATDSCGRLIGCQMFVNNKLVRDLRKEVPDEIVVRDVYYLKAISGG